ncbi:hypothetical protein CDAR_511091 [Caerostris darwini]|uniref:Uncharacterized protein n=1 Tax=Caerostris darwini TaxID=1538125 RepID=A0AAV4S2N9_9ARAC|nr:hypothetical protein CDAR_511091 [Caerostris darwini]
MPVPPSDESLSRDVNNHSRQACDLRAVGEERQMCDPGATPVECRPAHLRGKALSPVAASPKPGRGGVEIRNLFGFFAIAKDFCTRPVRRGFEVLFHINISDGECFVVHAM